VVFACNWCSYTAADLAGTTRLSMPPCFTVLRVMCSGRVDPLFILKAFALGADGVIVTGCHPGDCHYTSGNIHARRRVDFLGQVLDPLGLSSRLEMQYISAAEGVRFQHVLTDFAARVARLGPSPVPPTAAELPAHKRDAFRQLLRHLVDQLGIDVAPGAVISEETVAEGYGNPRYDPERCIGCGACAASCPQQNIEIRDADGTRRISHFHSRCVRCAACEESCPVEALEVVAHFDLAAFLSDEPSTAVELALVPCANCGAPVATERHRDHLVATLPEPTLAPQDSALCAACRRAAHAAEMRRHMVSYP
jgi:coenzyme F420-reducing hydrogenase delta subunit/ferredoxin